MKIINTLYAAWIKALRRQKVFIGGNSYGHFMQQLKSPLGAASLERLLINRL